MYLANSINIEITKTKDVTPPTLVLKNVSIYEGNKINDINKFISKVEDKGSTVKTTLLTEIDYSKIGDQKIEIEAEDTTTKPEQPEQKPKDDPKSQDPKP